MVAEGKNPILVDPWLVAIPGSVPFLLLLAIGLVGYGSGRALTPARLLAKDVHRIRARGRCG